MTIDIRYAFDKYRIIEGPGSYSCENCCVRAGELCLVSNKLANMTGDEFPTTVGQVMTRINRWGLLGNGGLCHKGFSDGHGRQSDELINFPGNQ